MSLNRLDFLLAQQGQSTMPAWTNVFPMVVMVVVFYLVFIRPQQKKTKDHENLLKTLKKGDKILTTGGVVATVITVKEKSVSIRSDESKFEIIKSAVAEVTERAGEPSET